MVVIEAVIFTMPIMALLGELKEGRIKRKQ